LFDNAKEKIKKNDFFFENMPKTNIRSQIYKVNSGNIVNLGNIQQKKFLILRDFEVN